MPHNLKLKRNRKNQPPTGLLTLPQLFDSPRKFPFYSYKRGNFGSPKRFTPAHLRSPVGPFNSFRRGLQALRLHVSCTKSPLRRPNPPLLLAMLLRSPHRTTTHSHALSSQPQVLSTLILIFLLWFPCLSCLELFTQSDEYVLQSLNVCLSLSLIH